MTSERKFRYSLKFLLAACSAASVLCMALFIVAPEVWALASELFAVRGVRKLVLACFGIAATFVSVVALGLIFRYATLLAAGLPEDSPNELPANDANGRE